MKTNYRLGCLLTLLLATTLMAADNSPRRVLQLDGQWQVAEGKMDQLPAAFDHTVPVPGLLDMATPPFEAPGSAVAGDQRRSQTRFPDPRREAFYYRRTFKVDGPLPSVALLKVNKAMFTTKVFVNGQPAGEHVANFTPGWFNVRPFLKTDGSENELVIRVGASLAQVPTNVLEGWDFEKSRYIPGIYDSVQLILSGTPHIVNVQTVPLLSQNAVRVVTEIANAGQPTAATLHYLVREAKSRKVVGYASAEAPALLAGQGTRVDVTIALNPAHCWTPEDPFLYEVEIDTGADHSTTRFGLRSFHFDPKSGRAYLNGKLYYLRGSNVCIYRFFEDADRHALPWDENWVRNLHRKFKEMHWNSLRYCIGFPPERWYEIADEEGVMIQDEFPIWYGGAKDGWPKNITVDHVASEYTEWMRERWNHPCVVIWDAQNETTDDHVIGPAIGKVRGLDLSQRPWDNGWGTPQKPGDVSEAHPYRSSHASFSLANLAKENGIPNNGPRQSAAPPYLINEYGWLWINRDGTLPTLTTNVYTRELGPKATVEQCREYYARTLAAKTEFWRVRRQCAGVLHFCGLGYSRHDGQTSDNFVDVRALKYEPFFHQYVRDAFAPIGVVIDWWEVRAGLGAKVRVPVKIVNDLEPSWQGEVTLRLEANGQVLSKQSRSLTVPGFAVGAAEFDLEFPATESACELIAEIPSGTNTIASHRQIKVAKPSDNSAFQRPVKASSQAKVGSNFYPASLAVDGNPATYWSSEFADNQWLAVDLGTVRQIDRVQIVWQTAFAKTFAVQVSTDSKSWKNVYETKVGKGGTDDLRFEPAAARHVRIQCGQRGTKWGHAICELQIFPAKSDTPIKPSAELIPAGPAPTGYLDANAPLEKRVDDLLSQLTLEEKVSLCSGGFTSGGIKRLGIGTLEMLDGRQGVRPMVKDINCTLLPCTLSLSCTWDESAARDFGRVLAEEMLALNRHVLLAPMMNLIRTPLGGRNFENLGEDPYLAGRMASAYIEGVQALGVGACSCLVVANDYEGRRHFTSSNMDDRTLRELHLLPYELSVRDGQVWSMMSANSLFNGTHCAHNRRLLQELVKDEIGFDGVMITDWRAAYDPVPSALAGTDMTTGFCQYVFGDGRFLDAIKKGEIPMALLDDKVRRILRLYFRSGVIDADRRAKGSLDTPEHRAAARRLGAEGMVLLKNEINLLPLKPATLKKILITGPGAQAFQQGGGSGKVPASYEITALDGLQSALGNACELTVLPWDEPKSGGVAKSNVEWSQGVAKGQAANTNAAPAVKPEIPALRAAAQKVDAVIFVAAGTRYSEGMDLRTMDLQDGQPEAIAALANANPRTIVVVITAGAFTLDPWAQNVPAILAAWYAGEATGDALADVLLGRVNPSGKLSFTFGRQLQDYPCHALGQWPAKLILEKDPVDPGRTPKDRKAIHAFDGEYQEGVFAGYRWFDDKKIKPAFPFGHGLSYTTFKYSGLTIDQSGPALRVTCFVKNTGDRSGAETVQVYIAPPPSSVPRPPRELKGFAKVQLQPGETRKIQIPLRPSALAFYDVTTRKWKIEPGQYTLEVAASSRDLRLRDSITIAEPKFVECY